MKRTVSEDRVPENPKIYANIDDVKSKMVDTAENLSEQGYGEDFMYQVLLTAPPIYDSENIIDEIREKSVYINVLGLDENGGREGEQFRPEYCLGRTEEFEEVTGKIDKVVEELGYETEFWHVSTASTSANSGSEVADKLDGLDVQVVAEVDAGLDSQRGKMGFQPISIGWFQKAPMNDEIQFGYRAFPNREFEHDKRKDYKEKRDEDLAYDILGRITGARDDETNMHSLSEDEADVLQNIEEEMNKQDLL